MSELSIEVIKLNETDMSPYSDRLARECGDLTFLMQWYWLMLVDDQEKPPLFYARYFGMQAHVRYQGLVRFSDSPQKAHEFHPLYDHLKGNGELDWKKVKGDPEGLSSDSETYEYRTGDPGFLYRGSSAGMRAVEEGVLDLQLKYFPYALKLTDKAPLTTPYVVAFGTVDGVLDGKPIRGMGGNEVVWACSRSDFRQRQMIFIDYCGVREDGRRECAYVMLFDNNDAFGFYWIDGEEPIVSRDVKYHGEWTLMEYAKEGPVVPLSLDFRFGGKEVHYRAKFGFRQWGDPIEEAQEVANSAGYCYVGDTPYKLDRCFATAEVHRFYPGDVRPNDF